MLELLILPFVVIIDVAYIIILLAISIPQEKAPTKKLPKVSVIIAAKEGKAVEKTLRMLKKIKIPKIEIIVASNDPKTIKIARKYTRKVVKDKGIGKGAALNLAVKRASCKIIYFMDEDMVVAKDTIARVCSALNGNEVATGFNVSENKIGIVARIARLHMAMLTKMQFGIYKLIGTTFVAGRNFAIYKKTLSRVGNFRNVLTEDLDLSFNLFRHSKKIKFVNALSKDQVPTKFPWYLKQQQRWNVGASQAIMEWEKRLHHHDIILFFFVVLIALIPLMSFIFLILAIIFSNYLFLSVVVLCFLICLSAAASLDKDDMALMPITFFMLMIIQSFAIIYSGVKKPTGWYRTPKE